MHIASPLAISLALIAAACTERTPTDPPEAPPVASVVPYALAEPDGAVRLDPRLVEISGLTPLANGHLGAVQDEDGDLFELDPASGAIVAERRFYNSGDYEGVEQVGDVIWVVESDGDLYRIAGEGEATKQETGLRRDNDVEGLAYDARGNRLLLALKGDPGGDLEDVRAIYAYDLATGRLADAPAYTLRRADLDQGGASFKPSGIAVHPASGEIYVLSGVLKALVVLSPEGERLAAISLPSHLYPQPEGIAFGADGTLYIANEGGGGAATLLRFSPTPLP